MQVYDDVLVPRVFEPLAELLLDEVGVQPGDRVLDVACGPGTVALAAARRGARVTGCDISAAMLDVARHKSSSITWVETAAAPLVGIDSESFDVVTCQQGLQFFPDRLAAAAEMHRALVPGGRVAVAVWADIEKSPPFVTLRDAVASVLGDEAADCFRHGPWALADPAEVQALLVDAGFAEVRVVQREVPANIDRVDHLTGMLPLSPEGVATDEPLHGWLVANVGVAVR